MREIICLCTYFCRSEEAGVQFLIFHCTFKRLDPCASLWSGIPVVEGFLGLLFQKKLFGFVAMFEWVTAHW